MSPAKPLSGLALVKRGRRLTGLLDQRAFRARLETEAARLHADARSLSLVALDLDHFQAVNDTQGPPVGDRVLAEAARRIGEVARDVDTVARAGGEEFAWLLPDADATAALEAAERLRAAIREAPFARDLDLTASLGVAQLGPKGDPDDLVARADEALYWAKQGGRDAVVTWTDDTAWRLVRARRDDVTFEQLLALTDAGHGDRVANLAVALAALRDWSPVEQGRLHRAARLHDLGKAALPDAVLDRPGPLTALETEHVRRHASLGAALAAPVLDDEQRAWILHHHERYDGLGYPHGIFGPSIPEGAQLLALADVWDAMTTDRPYRAALPDAEALAEIRAGSGSQFRPDGAALVSAARAWWR